MSATPSAALRHLRQIFDACGTDEKYSTPIRHVRLLYDTYATPAAPVRQLRHLYATCDSYATLAAPTRHLRHLCDTCGTHATLLTPLRAAARCGTTQRRSGAVRRGVTGCSGATPVRLAICSDRANIFSHETARLYTGVFLGRPQGAAFGKRPLLGEIFFGAPPVLLSSAQRHTNQLSVSHSLWHGPSERRSRRLSAI